ncbi:MAG: hypothetical protein IM638_15360 [Bacteroidetes bacterium]|nr:hypothetical protein [Bacteroidota bacterium]
MMKTYNKSLFSDIYTETIDLSKLINQYFVVINEDSSYMHLIHFVGKGTLNNIYDGIVTDGQWEFLNQSDVKLTFPEIKFIVRCLFFDRNIALMNLIGTEDVIVFVSKDRYEMGVNSIIEINKYIKAKNRFNNLQNSHLNQYGIQNHYSQQTSYSSGVDQLKNLVWGILLIFIIIVIGYICSKF